MNERTQYDKTNKAIVYVENGIFNRQGVESLMASRKPIIKVKANVDGKDVEIPLYFSMVYDEATGSFTDKYKVTSTGSKMLKGKVTEPWVADAVSTVDETSQLQDLGRDEPEDDVPF